MMNNYPKYTVLMSVYSKEISTNLIISIESMFNQTILPDEFLLIKDGPLTKELDTTISNLQKKYSNLKVYSLPKNVGAGVASNYGIPLCSNEYIARMDSDDYSIPTRIQESFDAMFKYDVDMVGSVIDEFVGNIENVIAHRMLPETDVEIRKFSKARSPIAHSAVLYKKSQVLACGNYENYSIAEDFILFAKMLKSGVKAYNIQHPLVFMRVSPNFFKRRGGFLYFCKIMKANKFLALNLKWMPLRILIVRTLGLAFTCFAPNIFREAFYKKFLRK